MPSGQPPSKVYTYFQLTMEPQANNIQDSDAIQPASNPLLTANHILYLCIVSCAVQLLLDSHLQSSMSAAWQCLHVLKHWFFAKVLVLDFSEQYLQHGEDSAHNRVSSTSSANERTKLAQNEILMFKYLC